MHSNERVQQNEVWLTTVQFVSPVSTLIETVAKVQW